MEIHALKVVKAEVLGRTILCCWRLPLLRILCLGFTQDVKRAFSGCSRGGLRKDSRGPEPRQIEAKRGGAGLKEGQGAGMINPGIGPPIHIGSMFT
jgi:hypothetical protein